MEVPKENHEYKIRALKLKIEELYEDIYQIKSEKNQVMIRNFNLRQARNKVTWLYLLVIIAKFWLVINADSAFDLRTSLAQFHCPTAKENIFSVLQREKSEIFWKK